MGRLAPLGLALLLSTPAFAAGGGAEDFAGATPPPAGTGFGPATDGRPGAVAAPTAAPLDPTLIDRPFLYLTEPRMPAAWQQVASVAMGYASTEAAARPLAASQGRGGLVTDGRLELGLLERVAAFGVGRVAPPLQGETGAHGAFEAGGRLLLTPPEGSALAFTLDLGGGVDFQQNPTALLRASGTLDLGPVRVGAMAHAERVFAADRDGVDLYVVSGVSVQAVGALRVGAEYVGQDLEDAWEDEEAEGGARHFAGATLAYSVGTFFASAGPAFGLGGGAPRLLGRAQVGTAF